MGRWAGVMGRWPGVMGRWVGRQGSHSELGRSWVGHSG